MSKDLPPLTTKRPVRWHIINTLIEINGYEDYLEIGIDKGRNFGNVQAKNKTSVDPFIEGATFKITSDEFFAENTKTFDIVFVDGLHHYEQAYRDAQNALKVLNPGGTVVMHDVHPRNKRIQLVPQQSKAWTGDVWRAWVRLRMERDDLSMTALVTDKGNVGCGIIQAGSQEPLDISLDDIVWEKFEKNKPEWLNLQSWNEDLVRGLIKR
jgi:SAM-dependent methyltransferase